MIRESLAPLADRQFRLLFTGRTVSLFGSTFAPVALAFAVLEIGDASDLGLVLAAATIPQILFILIGGVFADRLPRHTVMVWSDLVSGAAQAALAALILLEVVELWHFVALQVVRGTASAFFFPASIAIVRDVVTGGRIQPANALLSLTRNGTMILGAAAAGGVVAFVGTGWALAFDALTYAVGAAFLAALKLPRDARVAARNLLAELREGWSEFRGRTWLWVIVVEFAFLNATSAGAYHVLGPVVAKEELGGAAAWGLIGAATGVGLFAGAIFLTRWRPARPLVAASLGIALVVPLYWLLAEAAPLALLLAAAVLYGIGHDVFGILWNTALHEHVPREVLSRVSSYDALGSIVFMPVGYAVAGPVAAAIGVSETLWLSGALFLAATAAVLLVADVRNLRRLEAATSSR